MELTNAQLWVLPILAFLFCAAALSIAIYIFTLSQPMSQLTGANAVQVIRATNGFSGIVKDSIGTIQTTVKGILAGRSGALVNVSNNQIVDTKITGFIPNSLASKANRNLDSFSTILDMLQAASVLNQTTLGDAYFPESTPISTGDTLFTLLQKAQGNITAGNPNWFGNSASFTSSTPSTPINIFALTPSFGLPSTPPNFWLPGASAQLTALFSVNNNATTGTLHIVFELVNTVNPIIQSSEFVLTIPFDLVAGLVPITVNIWYGGDGLTLNYQIVGSVSTGSFSIAERGNALVGSAALNLSDTINFSLKSFYTGFVNASYRYFFTSANFLYNPY